MSLADRITSLQQEHFEADQLVKANDVPGACASMVRGLKLHRLHLKEELAKLGADTITKDRHKGVVPAVADTQPAVVEPTSLELRLVHNQELELAEMPTAETAPLQVAATA